jgi:AcrR family transcriptional regulator
MQFKFKFEVTPIFRYNLQMPTQKDAKAKPRSVRSDGVETRAHILQTAGRLFALKGYGRITSKEICEAAGTNMAAVNYHFGDKAGLYGAVLVAAHAQLVQLTDLENLQRTDQDHQGKLRALITLFVQRSADPALSWGLSVLVHELMAPSQHVATLVQVAVLPKVRIMMGLVSQLLELPAGHPAVQRALAFVVLPCVMLVIAPKDELKHILPALTDQPAALIDDMTDYALAGLHALKRKYQPAQA